MGLKQRFFLDQCRDYQQDWGLEFEKVLESKIRGCVHVQADFKDIAHTLCPRHTRIAAVHLSLDTSHIVMSRQTFNNELFKSPFF